jgi:beta-glucosidase
MRSILFLPFLLTSSFCYSQVYKDTKAPVEERVNDLLSKMTLEEKIDYMGGHNAFYIRAIDHLGLPEIKMSDGPVGTRNDGETTAYPASILSAATWDTALVNQLGAALGRDARARGVHILLAPGVNIYRAPMGGRNFEYFGEDPYLSARMAVNYINGLQSQHVVGTVKHFAGNNQEWDRNNVSSDIDERTLQEIYLPAFKAAVTEAHAGAVMNSYNLLNGEHATQNNHLNNEILKGQWKFDGILMSDWSATYDGVAAAKGGLDLEMPSGKFMNQKSLLPAVQNGRLSEEVINDHVRRILRVVFRFGFYDNPQKDASLPLDNPENSSVALQLAREGIVLLKNETNILPLSKIIKSIAVIGPNAEEYVAGGGSSYTRPFHAVTLLEGIKSIAPGVKLTYVRGMPAPVENHAETSVFYTAPGSTELGLKAEYYNNKTFEGTPVARRTEKTINHIWSGRPGVDGIGADNFSIRYTGVIRPQKTGTYKLGVKGDDGYRLYVNGERVIDEWHDQGANLTTASKLLEAGKEYKVTLEYYENGGSAQITFAYYQDALDFSQAIAAAKNADAVIFSIGFNSGTEGEGADRTFGLPEYQDSLIKTVAKVNANGIVVLNAGGNVDMQKWLSSVKGLVHAWFPGQEGGTAVAEILFGKTNPSGKLPASFENRWEDNPTFNSYYDDDKDKRVQYKEGLNIGYRYYDRSKVQPLFPFGFGLSYTNFSYSGLQLSTNGNTATVTFTVKNTGKTDGADVAQVYVHQQKSALARPEKELKGFQKVFLKAGESKTITIKLNADAFEYYNDQLGRWVLEPGRFDILVGNSSKNILLKNTITL